VNFVNEYALLFAVALPVATLAAIQVFLLATGERGTGLLPGFERYPSIAIDKVMAPKAAVARTATVEASNDEMERQAA
jgi:hypothetical protein